MPRGRTTHVYPHGMPVPLLLLHGGTFIALVLWVIFASGNLIFILGFFALIFLFGFISSRLHQTYERTGRAVQIRTKTSIEYVNGTPIPLRVLRYAALAIAAVLIGLGLSPLTMAQAKPGLIACVLALLGAGILFIAVNFYYASTGRAKSVDLSQPSTTTPERQRETV